MENLPRSFTLAILAAGIGSRYGGLKQIAPLGPSGEIMLDYAIYDAMQAGIDRVVFLIRPDMEALFRETIGHRFEKRIDTAYAFQRTDDPAHPGTSKWRERKKPWGTGHAILSCQTSITTPFLVINADDFYGRSAYRLAADFLAKHSSNSTDYAMVAYRLANTLSPHGTVARGVCAVGADNLLKTVVEETAIRRHDNTITTGSAGRTLTGDEPVSMNFWAFTPALFPQLDEGFQRFIHSEGDLSTREFMIPTRIQELMDGRSARVHVLCSTDSWFGVTYPQDVEPVRAEFAQRVHAGLYPSPLFS